MAEKYEYREEWWWVHHEGEVQVAKITWENAPGSGVWTLKWAALVGESGVTLTFDVKDLIAKIEPPTSEVR